MSRAADFKQRNVGASYRPDWETPPDVFAKIDAEFHFTLDAAANALNAKCDWFLVDGLDQSWGRNIVWLNPPYDKSLATWVAKARRESDAGATVVCLIPARTDTRWWHEHVEGRAEVRFIKGRIRFVGAPYNAPFPSCFVIYRPTPTTKSAVEVSSFSLREKPL